LDQVKNPAYSQKEGRADLSAGCDGSSLVKVR